MARFLADLHIHSRFSRATSKHLDLPVLASGARRKGIAVVGTGDITHPAWRAEIGEMLRPGGDGLLRLREDPPDPEVPPSCRGPVRFLLTGEISTIYKRDGRVRKVHHLVCLPDLEAAERLAATLGRIGNLAGDGRPILGLDSRDLLEIVLETGPNCHLIPAHIWTPWFSALGSKSGFDSIQDCYGELSSHLFAVETGLSSDPPMNWRVSSLDDFTLVSHSDAHSAEKLGRETNLLAGEPTYQGIFQAMRSRDPDHWLGTVEFFPEEGKYHQDGHRKCGARLEPAETVQSDGRCPVCGKPVTVGVLSRVEALADRPSGVRPDSAAPFHSLIPLAEILGEILGRGPATKTVRGQRARLLDALGPELHILMETPLPDLAKCGPPLLAEALGRMRSGQVIRQAGYDGEYGVIRLFEPEELDGAAGRLQFPGFPEPAPLREPPRFPPARPDRSDPTPGPLFQPEPASPPSTPPVPTADSPELFGLNPDQRAAVEAPPGPLLISAGPGTGKTRVLTCRIARRIRIGEIAPREALAVTFTHRAAGELRQRLETLLGREAAGAVTVHTFHALGWELLREHPAEAGLPPGARVLNEAEREELVREAAGLSGWERSSRKAGLRLEELKRELKVGDEPEHAPELRRLAGEYRKLLDRRGALDFADLVSRAVRLLEEHPAVSRAIRSRFRSISVDEYQDVNQAQQRLLDGLAPPGSDLCVIGDPDQAIYGFRGADATFFEEFPETHPGTRTVRLRRSYRSTGPILEASRDLLGPASVGVETLASSVGTGRAVQIHRAATPAAEAEFVAHSIERLVGGIGFFSMDSGRLREGDQGDVSFADVAVLFRLHAVGDQVEKALARLGVPFQRPGRNQPGEEQPSDAALREEADRWDHRAERVSLLTLHASKGLEFPVVFIVGCEDGLLPYRPPGRTAQPADPHEERRLLYVGMTRAERLLILTAARRRTLFGRTGKRNLSPFVVEILQRLEEEHPEEPRARPVKRQMGLFD